MADTPLRTLSVLLEANTAPMRDSLAEAEKIVSDTTGKMEESFKSIGGSMDNLASGATTLRVALAGMLSGVSLAAFIAWAQSANKELADMNAQAQRVGVSIERFQ